MAKQLNVDLRFNADTSAAKAQLQSLQTSINQLTTSMATQGTQLGITPKIQEAQQAAVQLKTALSQSMNVETGKFDLSKFNSSLKSMNTDLSKLKTQLVNLGPSGQQTFMTLAQSIMTAEIPTKRISASLAALGTTLKNTAKWQLSSTMLHGFMSAVQTSYRYAQDLNKSLNNIRIVTGESAEAMDQFAAKANKAAKALSASTLDYTNAALIYYQQGLKGKDVEERTEVTLKLANVSRQSAEVVSDQMTAIWNNFYDGSKSLEYYADVLTALGASTASSTEEIAGGLEKFAAVGETIGLSYEYAASALATITANTRQSEEVVGTALKTIFARIQGLKLGETLEDGTSLNKYSQALETVGVHIYNASGGLKNMDTILDETAEKWGALTKDQQAALAQTVAGVRQYTQFIALMDNWNDGTSDSMVKNLETANNAMGTLQEQQDIYAESWEAARDRAKAAAEELYMSLLDDDFFIGLTDGFADFLGLLDNFIDAMGGAKGLLSGLASILLYTFSGPAAKALESMVYNFKSFVGLTQKEAMGIKQQAFNLASNISVGTGMSQNTPTQLATTTGMQNQLQLEQDLLNIKDKLTEAEQLQAKYIIEQNNAYSQQAVQVAQQLEVQKEKTRLATQDMREAGLVNWDTRTVEEKFNVIKKDIGLNEEIAAELERVNQEFLKAPTTGAEEYVKKIEGLIEKSRSRGMEETAVHLEKKIKVDGGKGAYRTAGGLETQARADKNIVDNIRIKQQQDIENKTRNVFSTGRGQNKEQIVDDRTIEKTTKSMTALVQKEQELKKTNEGVAENTKKSSEAIKNLGNTTRSWSQTMVGAAQGVMSLSFAISSLNSLKTTWADETIGTGEKLLQTFMSLGMAIPMLINGWNGLKTAYLGSATVSQALISLNQARLAQYVLENNITTEKLATMQAENLAQQAHISLSEAEQAIATAKIITKTTELGLTQDNIAAMTAEQLVEKTGMTLDQATTVIKAIKNGVTLEEALAEAGLTTAKGAGVVMTKLATVANWGFLASMSPILAITLVLVAALAGLALVIWGVVSAVKFFINNSPEGKLKAAREESAALTEELNKTKQAAQDLKDSFDSYNEIQKKLSECKKGTEEWNEALRENNDKVLELLEKYPQLRDTAGAITIGADGQLIISEEAMASVINLQAQKVAVNTIADNSGKAAVRGQEIENKEKEFNTRYSKPQDLTHATADVQIFYTAKEKYGTGNLTDEQLETVAKELYKDSQYDYLVKDGAEAAKKVVQLYNEINQLKEEDRSKTQLENVETGQAIMAGLDGQEEFNYRGNIAAVIGYNTVNDENRTYSTKDYNDFIKNSREGENLSREEMVGAYREALADKAWASFGTNGSKRAEDAMAEYISQRYGEDAAYEIVDFEGDQVRFKVNGGEEEKLSYDAIAEQMMAFQQKENQAKNNKILANYISGLTSQDQADVFSASQTGIFSEQLLEKNKEDIDKIIESLEISDEVIQAMGEDLDGNNKYNQDDVALWKKKQKEILNSQKAFNNFKKNGVKALDDIHAVLKDVKFDQIADPEQKAAIQAQASEISSMLSETLGVDSDLGLDPDFINDNYQIIQNFLNNVEDSGVQLQKALQQDALEDVIVNIDVNDKEARQAVTSMHDYIINNLENQDFQIGVGFNTGDFFDKCQSIVTAAGMTSEQAQEYFGKMGFDIEGETKTKTTKQTHTIQWPVYGDAEHPLQVTDWETKTWDDTSTQEYFALKTITPNASFGGNIDNINDSGGNTSDSTKTTNNTGNINPDGGGGKNTPKDKTFKEKDKKEKKLYEDEFDRYRDITTALDDYNRELEETQELKDELWGADKLAAMDAEKKKLGEITKKQKEYIKAISGSEDGTFKGGYLQTDVDALKQLDSEAKFDANGNLLNYHELTQKWLNEMNAAQDTWNAGMEKITDEFNANKKSESADEIYDTKKTGLDDDLEKAEDIYEKRKAALDKWQETYDLNEEQKQQLEDYLRQMRQLNYEKLEYKIEIRVELNENDIEDIEFQLDRLGEDNVYSSAERIALIEKNAASYKAIADAQIEGMREAERLYAAGEISQTDYIARLQESKEAIQDAERSIREGIQKIGEELQNTFDMADEKLDQQYEKFDRITELMDHYKNVISLTEGDASYRKFNQLLRTQQEVLRDRIEVNQSEIAMWEAQEAELRAAMDDMDENSPEYLAAEQALNSIVEKQADAKSQMMADIEQLGEYAREIFENSIEQAMVDFEEAMFGGTLSSVIESIDMLNAKQEELLTTTNKIYETNKMLRNIEKDIEATTNQRAKQAYNEFAAKVKQKQEQNELTKFELDLLTAEYEITKAQIALEEAKDAKDTVRLTRDAEGNYGYVYTANQDKVSEAEQALDDATNNYYNTALEGAQKYQDQIYSHIQEWEEKVKEVMLDQTLSEEEKNAKIKEINDTYNTLITQDKELYYKAIGAMQDSAYNLQVDYDLKGIESAEKWFTECDGFIADMKAAQDEYDENTKEITEHTEENFGKMSASMKEAKKDSENLKTASKDLADNLNDELIDAVGNAKDAWEEYADQLREVIRLNNEAIQINDEAEDKSVEAIEDYSLKIGEEIAKGEQADWEYINSLIRKRDQKIANGEFDENNINYAAEMDKLKPGDPMWITYAILRNNKIKKLGLKETPTDLSDYGISKEIGQYKTGGYTGEWGPEGKLAVLHQKELVLNAQDTANFLTATEMLREISQMLDTNALVASLGAISLSALSVGNPADQVLQQEVTIHADFPNVTDHNEIEIAIDNLINAASQHAYRA